MPRSLHAAYGDALLREEILHALGPAKVACADRDEHRARLIHPRADPLRPGGVAIEQDQIDRGVVAAR